MIKAWQMYMLEAYIWNIAGGTVSSSYAKGWCTLMMKLEVILGGDGRFELQVMTTPYLKGLRGGLYKFILTFFKPHIVEFV